MRFAALQGSGVGDYIAAGKAGADATVKSFAINRKTAPDYGKIAQTSMAARSAERIAATEAGAQVTKAAINAVGDVTSAAQSLKADDKIRKMDSKMRKAGGIAALGKVAAAGFL